MWVFFKFLSRLSNSKRVQKITACVKFERILEISWTRWSQDDFLGFNFLKEERFYCDYFVEKSSLNSFHIMLLLFDDNGNFNEPINFCNFIKQHKIQWYIKRGGKNKIDLFVYACIELDRITWRWLDYSIR